MSERILLLLGMLILGFQTWRIERLNLRVAELERQPLTIQGSGAVNVGSGNSFESVALGSAIDVWSIREGDKCVDGQTAGRPDEASGSYFLFDCSGGIWKRNRELEKEAAKARRK